MAGALTPVLLDEPIGVAFETKFFVLGTIEASFVILSARLGAKDLAFGFEWSSPSGLH